MEDNFFSREVSWRRVWFASFISALVFFIAGFLLWYFFLYLPIARHLLESQKVNEELRQLYELKDLPVNSSTIPK
jgi:Sec-independent protein secretion pathway component TatC